MAPILDISYTDFPALKKENKIYVKSKKKSKQTRVLAVRENLRKIILSLFGLNIL